MMNTVEDPNKTRAHSVRSLEEQWMKAKKRADSENVTMTHMVTELLEGYSRGLVKLPKPPAKPKSGAERAASHSVRTTDGLWHAAKARATGEGLKMNDVVVRILEGYGSGMLNLPKVTKTFGNAKTR